MSYSRGSGHRFMIYYFEPGSKSISCRVPFILATRMLRVQKKSLIRSNSHVMYLPEVTPKIKTCIGYIEPPHRGHFCPSVSRCEPVRSHQAPLPTEYRWRTSPLRSVHISARLCHYADHVRTILVLTWTLLWSPNSTTDEQSDEANKRLRLIFHWPRHLMSRSLPKRSHPHDSEGLYPKFAEGLSLQILLDKDHRHLFWKFVTRNPLAMVVLQDPGPRRSTLQ